jgi:hypothetical protein
MQACTAGYTLTYLATLKRQLVTSTALGLTVAKFKSVMHAFSLSSCTYISSSMILDEFYLFPA